MTALNRTFALAQINDIAMAIGHNLNFNMAWLLNIFLNKDPGIAKAGTGFVGRTLETVSAIRVIPSHTHTLAAATRRSFKHHRVANSGTNLYCMIGISNHICIAGNTVDPGLFSDQLRGDFIAH